MQNGDFDPGLDKSAKEAVTLTRCSDVELRLNTPKGRGVFATRAIPARTVIDVSPVLVFAPEENATHIQQTALSHYTYTWPWPYPHQHPHPHPYPHPHSHSSTPPPSLPPPPPRKTLQTQALPLGLGALFNHAPPQRQNIGFTRDAARGTLTYVALRDVAAGEELCVCYGAWGTAMGWDADADADADAEAECEEADVEAEAECEEADVGAEADGEEEEEERVGAETDGAHRHKCRDSTGRRARRKGRGEDRVWVEDVKQDQDPLGAIRL